MDPVQIFTAKRNFPVNTLEIGIENFMPDEFLFFKISQGTEIYF